MKIKLQLLIIFLFNLQPNVKATCSGTLTYTSSSGTFDDGSGPDNYDNNSNCQFLISPGAGYTNITLSFNEFFTEDFFDFVYVYDGPTTGSPSLGIFNGNTLPANITSTGNQVLILFTSDNSVPKSGWSVNYDAHFCSGTTTFTTPAGSFSDGSGVDNYSNYSDCSYLISPGVAFTNITLNFNNFNTENNFDFVKVYDGPTTASTLLATYTGTTLPSSLNSSGNKMLVVFTSDNSNVSPGWDASYVANIYCGGTTTLTSPTGSFSDGSGANDYVINSNCSWLISPSGTFNTIALDFSSINTEAGVDLINVYDGPTTTNILLGSFSGASIPPTIHSSGMQMLVVFNSDADIQGQGWNASYITNCTPQVSISGNAFICPGETSSFTADVTNGGSSPSFQWKLNGINAGTNSSSYAPSSLQNGDIVSVELTSNEICAYPLLVSNAVTIHSGLPNVSILASATTVCSGNSITLNGTGASNYFWNHGVTDGVPFIPPPGSTTYTVTGTDTYGCSATSTIFIYVKPVPIPVIESNSGSFIFCNCNSISLKTKSSYNRYLWSTGATTRSIGVHTSGIFTVTVTNSFGCTGSASVTTIANNGKPSKPVAINGNDKGVCKQNGVVYSIDPVAGAINYKWVVPNGVLILNGQGTTSITTKFLNSFSSSGIISVKAQNECGSSSYRSLTINSSPKKPADITGPSGVCQFQQNVTYSILPVFGATNYTWTVPHNATIVSGQGNVSVVVNFGNSAGEIKVKSRNYCGSSSYRDLDISFNCREAAELIRHDNIKIFPNPVHDRLNIEIYSDQNQKCNLKMIDLLGKQILSDNFNLVEGNNNYSFDMNFPKGIYILVIELEGLPAQTIRVVVE